MYILTRLYPKGKTKAKMEKKFFNVYWSIVDSQCCVSFRCTAVNQLCMYIYPLFFRLLSHIIDYRVLSRVPCAIQQALISYLFYIQQCVYVNPNLPIYPSSPLFPVNCKFFYICNSVLQISSFAPFQIQHISSILCVFLCLTSLSMAISRSIHVAANGIISFFFLRLSNIPLYIYIPHFLYPFLC